MATPVLQFGLPVEHDGKRHVFHGFKRNADGTYDDKTALIVADGTVGPSIEVPADSLTTPQPRVVEEKIVAAPAPEKEPAAAPAHAPQGRNVVAD